MVVSERYRHKVSKRRVEALILSSVVVVTYITDYRSKDNTFNMSHEDFYDKFEKCERKSLPYTT